VPAVAALLLAGCGGGSSEDEVTTTPASSGDRAQAGAGQKSGSAAPGKTSNSPQSKTGSAQAQAPDAASPQGKGQKHGQRVTIPKGAPEQAPTPAQVASATVADMTLESPAITPSAEGPGRLPATYTCGGENSWPTLRWTGVPAGTAELALFAMNMQPVEGKLFVDWAVAGLDPGLQEIEAGKLPRGAVIGTNGFGKRGYSICPSGAGEIYMFAVYALPTSLSPKPGFDARELRKEVLGVSGNVGLLAALYAR